MNEDEVRKQAARVIRRQKEMLSEPTDALHTLHKALRTSGGTAAIELKFGKVRVIADRADGSRMVYALGVTHEQIDPMLLEAAAFMQAAPYKQLK